MNSTVFCSMIAGEVTSVQSRVDLQALDFDALLNELVVARIAFLDNSARRNYLIVERVSPLGFLLNLIARITEAKTSGSSRLTSQDQDYDLEIHAVGDVYRLRDLSTDSSHAVDIDRKLLTSGLSTCAEETFSLLQVVFPQLRSHPEMDRIRKLLPFRHKK